MGMGMGMGMGMAPKSPKQRRVLLKRVLSHPRQPLNLGCKCVFKCS